MLVGCSSTSQTKLKMVNTSIQSPEFPVFPNQNPNRQTVHKNKGCHSQLFPRYICFACQNLSSMAQYSYHNNINFQNECKQKKKLHAFILNSEQEYICKTPFFIPSWYKLSLLMLKMIAMIF